MGIGGIPTRILRHGHYKGTYPPSPDREIARERLGLAPGIPMLLMLGQVRPHKNAPTLVETFDAMMGKDAHLAVVGEVVGSETLEADLRAAAAGKSSVTLKLHRATSSAVALWHAAADVVVLPYSLASSLQSGAAMLALSRSKPVVLPYSAASRELQQSVGANWIYLFHLGMEDVIDAAWYALHERRGAAPDINSVDWDALARQAGAPYDEAAEH